MTVFPYLTVAGNLWLGKLWSVVPHISVVDNGKGRAVRVVFSERGGRKDLQHVGTAHSDAQLAALKARAQAIIDGEQQSFDFGLDVPAVSTGSVTNPVPITRERAGCLLDVFEHAWQALGFDAATADDQVFKHLVFARLIQPGSKIDSIETLAEVGVQSASYATIKRYLPTYATQAFQHALTHAAAKHTGIGPGVLVLYDVTTLYFETDTPDELRKPGFSKERRVDPQITVGMLADARGFPLQVGAFEGNRAETHTMLPMIRRFQQAYGLDDITVVADAGMFSAANKRAIAEAGLGYILGTRFQQIPPVIHQWRQAHPDQEYVHGQVWSAPKFSTTDPNQVQESVTHYQYSWDRARRSLRGIKEQVAKAQKAVEGKIPVKRNRYVKMTTDSKTVDWSLVQKNTALAGIKGYETNRLHLSSDQVIDAYRQLFAIEQSFRMSKHDLKARPIYHRKHDSIHAHLTVVMAAMAIGHYLEDRSGKSLKRLVRILKKYRTFEITVQGHTIHAASETPPEISDLITQLTSQNSAN